MQQGLCTKVDHQSNGAPTLGSVGHPLDMQREQQVLAPHGCPSQMELQMHRLILKGL